MAKEKTVPELEKELIAALKQLEDSQKALTEVQAKNETLENSMVELAASHEEKLTEVLAEAKSEKEALEKSIAELVEAHKEQLAEALEKDGIPVDCNVFESEIALIKDGIARHVNSEAEAGRWEAKGYLRKTD